MGLATYTYNRSTSGGEIITHLVNSSDGQGLDFANGALLQLEYEAGGVFGTSDFSIEFIIDQSSGNANSKYLYTSGGNNEFQITSETASSKIELTFDGADYDFSYDMSADYGSPVHYVMTFDRSALATLYKDGNSVATVDISGSSAVDLDNSGTAVGYLGGVSDYGVTGVFYRWRTWKKLLSAAEVTACYENASVPIADQWSNCVTDLDFAFANPERSLSVRSRSGAGDATASAGIFQITPIEQLNSKSARIGTTAATPADGELAVSGNVGVGCTPDAKLEVNGDAIWLGNAATDASGRILFNENTSSNGTQGFSLLYAGRPDPTLDGTAFTAATNTFNIFRHNSSAAGAVAMSIARDTGISTFSNGIVETNGVLKENLLTNSGFDVWSNSTLEDVGTQITVSDVTSGVCTTTETEGLAVGKLFKFNAGDFNSEVFEITALTDDTSFTLNDTSKSDSGTPGTGYEVTPGCVDGNSKAFDGWDKNGSSQYGDIWRQHNDATLTHDGSFYSLKMTSHAASTMQVYSKPSYPFTDSINLQKYAGRTVTMGAWVYVSDSSTPSVFINDTTLPWTGMDSSDIHSGATGWEWLEVTKTISASPGLFVTGVNQIANKTCYISSPILVLGSAIGSGNYSRPSGEIVWCESQFSSKLVANGYSNVNSTSLNLEADSDGKIPKGAKAVHAWLQIRDSDPSGETETRMQITGLNGSPTLQTYVAGLPAVSNGCIRSSAGFVGCTSDGDVDYVIDASGDSTLDITGLRYNAVQLR